MDTEKTTTNSLVSLPDEHPIIGIIGAKITTTNPLVSLPVEIFNNILEYLDWGDVGRLDTAFLSPPTKVTGFEPHSPASSPPPSPPTKVTGFEPHSPASSPPPSPNISVGLRSPINSPPQSPRTPPTAPPAHLKRLKVDDDDGPVYNFDD